MKVSALTILDHYPDRPRSIGELYQQARWQCLKAEELGLHGFFVAEHHFSDYGVAPDPLLLLASFARDTHRIRLGTGISIATFHDPRIAAGSYCQLDQLCQGRFALGLGSGFLPNEFEALGIDLSEKRARFDEALAVIRPLVRGEAATLAGRYVQCRDLRLNVRPWHPTGIPLHLAVMNREAFPHAAAHGEALIAAPYATLACFDDLPDLIGEIGAARAIHGVDEREDIWSLHCFVDTSYSTAVERARKHFELYMGTRLYAPRIHYHDFLDRDLSLIGSVDTVAEKLCQMQRWGVRHVLLCFDFGLMAPHDIERSMSMLMQDVLPRLDPPPRDPAADPCSSFTEEMKA